MRKKLLYITDTVYKSKSGAGIIGSMHYDMFNKICGKNMFSVFACEGSTELIDEKVYQGYSCSKKDKIEAVLGGYPPYLSKKVRLKIFEIIETKKIEIVYIDNSISGKLIEDIKQKWKNVKVIVFFHDIEAVLMNEWMPQSRFVRKMALKKMIENESLTVKYADKKIVLNQRDYELYQKVYGNTPDYIVPVAVPLSENRFSTAMHSRNDVIKMLFVGTDYKPNLDAIKWFLENVANKVKDKAILKVVGYKLEKYKDKFIKYSNIEIEGTVDDLSKYYRDADLVIAPIFSGGGMKIKTAEAFGYGKFFAGTDESLIGYWEMVPDALKNKKVFLCNTPKEYVELINSLYEIDFNKYNGDICSWMQEEYSFESNNRKYENIWKNIN